MEGRTFISLWMEAGLYNTLDGRQDIISLWMEGRTFITLWMEGGTYITLWMDGRTFI